ncbi:UDP-N-acetylglucosamine 1-carboxyvinyltransferase [Wolbachia endosymbiont of Glossina morsitans morsitans]|nr:UDP-N-acetylglucosamine 1-carboxyvinyltransferase [Wolbachia endosymbiont of Glossina morsitans morsitans]
MAASLLSSSPVILHNVPDLIDVHLMSKLLESLGAEVNFMHNKNYKANHTLKIDCSNINNHVMPYKTASKLRTSFLILGPMLSRFGKARTAFPGGCNIGKRPVDMHIKALEEMGAKIEIDGYNIIATVKGKLQGKEITFEKISVGATENVIMAATFAEGVTTINNAATEPEVLDLIDFLKKMGADIEIDNTKVIITGVEALNGCVHKIIPDRIEAGTYALAAIITGGKLELEGINLSDIRCVTNELETIGAMVELYDGGIVISRKNGSIKSANVATDPYPNFPSDMQPQLMSAMCIADGISVIEENIFENRFTHADELRKLGANISIEKGKATISGIKSLSGANLYATDLRSTAALVLASLVAGGETIINNSHHLWRGYEAMHEKLNSCGADISISS